MTLQITVNKHVLDRARQGRVARGYRRRDDFDGGRMLAEKGFREKLHGLAML
jgi:hypothetical protein